MPKIERYNGNVIAFSSGQQSGERFVFGSSTVVSDNLTDQYTPEAIRGWATVGPSEFPPLEWFNAVGFTATQFIAYLHQMGVPEWNPSQEYPTQGAIVIHNGVKYSRGASWSLGDEPGVAQSWISDDNFVVDSGVSGGVSYRIYSNGTIDMWGAGIASGNTPYTINLPFSIDSSLMLDRITLGTRQNPGTSAADYGITSVTSVSSSSFSGAQAKNDASGFTFNAFNWSIKGGVLL